MYVHVSCIIHVMPLNSWSCGECVKPTWNPELMLIYYYQRWIWITCVWISEFLGNFSHRNSNIVWVKQPVHCQPGNTRGKHLDAGAHQTSGSRKSSQGECKYTEMFMEWGNAQMLQPLCDDSRGAFPWNRSESLIFMYQENPHPIMRSAPWTKTSRLFYT